MTRPPIERWECPTAGCGHWVELFCGPAHAPPTCPHGGTPRHAAPAALMVRVAVTTDEKGVG